jgi:hypothetical protein
MAMFLITSVLDFCDKVLLNAWLHIFKRQRREQELGEYEVVEEIIYGLESGILFGYLSVPINIKEHIVFALCTEPLMFTDYLLYIH